MHIAVQDGVTYNVELSGEGEPVVFLHGFTGSCLSWQSMRTSLQSSYKVIAIDLLGHGLTDCPADYTRYTIERTTDDLADICRQLQLKSVYLVGYSMGGRVALSFAIRYPKLVKQLILESASPGLQLAEERKQRQQSDEQLATKIVQQGIAWFADYWGNIPLFDSQKKLSSHAQQAIHASRLHNNAIGLANSLKGLGTGQQPSYWEQLEQLDIPVTLIVGELDQKYVHIAHKMKQLLPQAVLASVEQAGHNVHLEQPEAFLQHLRYTLD